MGLVGLSSYARLDQSESEKGSGLVDLSTLVVQAGGAAAIVIVLGRVAVAWIRYLERRQVTRERVQLLEIYRSMVPHGDPGIVDGLTTIVGTDRESRHDGGTDPHA